MLAVQPQPDGLNDSTLILSASPGCAPSMKTGPVTGLTSEKSSFGTSAVVEAGVSWPHDGSRVSNCTVSPGAIVRRGGKALFQPGWPWSRWIVCLAWLCMRHAYHAAGNGFHFIGRPLFRILALGSVISGSLDQSIVRCAVWHRSCFVDRRDTHALQREHRVFKQHK